MCHPKFVSGRGCGEIGQEGSGHGVKDVGPTVFPYLRPPYPFESQDVGLSDTGRVVSAQ